MKTPLADHVGDHLPELVLGTLAPATRTQVEAHLATCPACQSELRGLARAASALPWLERSTPPGPQVLSNVLAQVEGPERFLDYADRLADLFDVSEAEAKRLSALLVVPQSWEAGPADGIDVIPVVVGPKRAGGFAGFVRIPPGRMFPAHRHLAVELNLVLQGGFREGNREVWRGDLVQEDPGSVHSQFGLPGVDCIAASVAMGEIELVPKG